MNHGVPTLDSGLLQTRASSRTRWTLVCTAYLFVCVRVCERSRERAMRRIWEPCSFVGQQGVCTVCFPTFYIFMYPHLQIAVSVDAFDHPRISTSPASAAAAGSAASLAGVGTAKALTMSSLKVDKSSPHRACSSTRSTSIGHPRSCAIGLLSLLLMPPHLQPRSRWYQPRCRCHQ